MPKASLKAGELGEYQRFEWLGVFGWLFGTDGLRHLVGLMIGRQR